MTTLSKWRPTAYILPCTMCICNSCGSQYTMPSPLRVQIATGLNTTRLISIRDFAARLSIDTKDIQSLSHLHTILPTLPRFTKRIHTMVDICPHCFLETPKSQGDFWPHPPPNTLSVASIEAQRRKDAVKAPIIPATADDI